MVDAGRVVPLRKQQGFLNMVGQLVSVLGPKLHPHLPRVLGLVVHLGAASDWMLQEQRQLVSH